MLRTLLLTTAIAALAGPPASGQVGRPATFFGTAAIDGRPVADGTPVRAFVEGKDCTQPGARGTITDGGVSVYSIAVMAESQEAGCGVPGRTVTFTVGGRAAAQQSPWSDGVATLNLNAGMGSPLPLPTATTAPAADVPATQTAAARFTPRPATTALPTDDPGVLAAATATPASDARENGSSVFPVLLVVAGAVAAVGAVAGALLAHRRPPSG